MSEDYTVTGVLIHIGETLEFDSGFLKRTIVVKTAGDYPQEIPMDLVKGRAVLADRHIPGDQVTAHFNLRGNESKTQPGRWFVNLNCWRIESDETDTADAPDQQPEPGQDDSDVGF